jgi:pre-mRNA-splicing factor RBM22/SLT11
MTCLLTCDCCCHVCLYRTITSLYVGGVTPEITEDDLRDAFYTHGELAGVRKVASRFCAFVTFTERSASEKAAEALHNKLVVKGVRLRLMWGRGGQAQRGPQQPHDPMQPIPSGAGTAAAAGGGGGGGAQAGMAAAAQQNYFGLPEGGMYPSMDPSAQGSAMKRPGEQEGQQDGSKRPRSGVPVQTGYGAAPMAPMPMPPHMMMPPPGYGPPMGMPPMGMFPPPGAFPPAGSYGMPMGPPPGMPPPAAFRPPPAAPPSGPPPVAPPAMGAGS